MFITLVVLCGACLSLFTFTVLSASVAAAAPKGRRRAPARLEGQHVGLKFLQALLPVTTRLAPLGDLVTWMPVRSWVAKALQRAGLKQALTVNQFFASSVCFAVATPLLAVFAGGATRPLTVLASFVMGGALPALLLRDLWRMREQHIVRLLPGTVDVLSLSVEAGLEFLMAVQRVVERGEPSPLRDELATVLQDIRLGQTRAEALKGLATRVSAREVGEFCAVLIQADLLGASIATTLKALASRMRVERFQRAEKAGAKAAQKIRVPMMLFIFPAVLLLILAIAMGPSATELFKIRGLL